MSKKNVKSSGFNKPRTVKRKIQYRFKDNDITLRELTPEEKPVKFTVPPNPTFKIKPFTEKDFIKEWIDNNEDQIETTVESGCEQHDEDSEEYKKCKEGWEESLTDDARRDYYYYLDKFKGFENPFKVYRMINVEDFDDFMNALKEEKYVTSYKGIGIFWSWDEGSAESHWSQGGEKIIITALVDKKDVDWNDTVLLNTNLSLGEEEAEIRMFPRSEIMILNIERRNTKENIPFKRMART